MSIDDLKQDARRMTSWEQHRFFVLIAGVILTALFLVSVALSLYNSSGTAQVDLSRPGYQSVRSQAARDTTEINFSPTGTLDRDAIEQYRKLYASRASKVTGSKSFDAAALAEDSLHVFGAVSDQAAPTQP